MKSKICSEGVSRAEWARRRKWITRALAVEAALVAVFVWCCVSIIAYKPEPDVLTVIRDVPVPVEVTVAPDVSEDQDGRSEAAMALARTVWGEARGCSTTEQAGVAWCVLNRVDSPEFPDTVEAVCSQRTETVKQFDGYSPDYPVDEDLLALAEDVLARWELEKLGVGSVGRVLPADYLFFEGDGQHNHFRKGYIKTGETWDWSLPSPYKVNDAEGVREGPLGGED